MGIIEEISQMRSQGMPDQEIMANLQDKGVSAQAIGDAINQSQIKQAVTDTGQYPQDDQSYAPQPGGMGSQEVGSDMYMPQEQGYQDYYPQDQGGGGASTSTMVEIAEQVFTEKIQKIQKQVRELSEFKTLMESKIEHLTDRIKRVENMMDKTQMAILDKVGSYGKGLDKVKKEVGMVQDSFAKMVPSLANKAKHHSTSTKSVVIPTKKPTKKTGKNKSKRLLKKDN
ncbi:MAG: hypothetical protein IIA85_00515 [Nanoarchaeota archaeon]|nr:hypothetical protein [Nanoarchaeota archaeon]